jgi:Mrp family chromosome partitioning ATPase
LARAARKLDGTKALLIDADLATSGLSRLANSANRTGMRQLPEKPDLYPHAVLQVGSDLDILPAGSEPGAGMSELVAAGALETLLSAAFRDYRYVFWDTHALGRSADTGLLMTVVTGVILVTESDVTRMDQLSSRLAEIANARAHAVAVLRNRAGRRPFSAGP